MAAFIPSRRDAEVNEVALARVTEDKRRESEDGFDGSWVAHPDLVPVAMAEFDAVLGQRPNQLERLREDVTTQAADLLDVAGDAWRDHRGGRAGERLGRHPLHRRVAPGVGAAAIDNLMEDAATAEISRSQIWQWIRHGRVERSDVERIIARGHGGAAGRGGVSGGARGLREGRAARGLRRLPHDDRVRAAHRNES